MRRAAKGHGNFPVRLALESLETRAMMSASTGSLGGVQQVRQLVWNGRSVEAFADAWVVKTNPATLPAATLGVTGGWRTTSLGDGFYSLQAPGATAREVLGWAAGTACVSYVEPDVAIAPQALPNDPSFSRTWGLQSPARLGTTMTVGINAPGAWEMTTGSRNVVVAVIDTGVDYTHPDLAANIWTNPREIPGDGVDNDGDGFVDDVHGYDFANNDGDPMDDNGHGTHVAGTIGAVGNNGTGVTGVDWQVSIMPLKFLSGSGSGSTSGAIAAINYATRMKRDFGVNVVATNNSWGGGGFSTALRDAIDGAGRAGILFVAAAGNDGVNIDASPSYPAAYPGSSIISVAAVDRSGSLATFSNFGTTNVDVAAPGVGILSTTPRNTYSTYSGTSMATPHVTGTVALLAAANPRATAAQIRTAILSTAVPLPSLAGKVATGGMLDAAAAVRQIGGVVTPVPDPTPAPVAPPVSDPSPPTVSPSTDPGDTLATALPVRAALGATRFVGLMIGDGGNGDGDVDLFKVTLQAGQRITIDIDAQSLDTPSTLDSYVRLFNAAGREIARNDDSSGSYDSFLGFTATKAGTYYVGVSGFGNSWYRPAFPSFVHGGSTGIYELTVTFGPTTDRRTRESIRALGFPDVVTDAARQMAFVAFGQPAGTGGRGGDRRSGRP